MASSLLDQLKERKSLLRKSNIEKNFEAPKTSGFLTQEEIDNYNTAVLDVNTECWLDALKDYTFPTVYCPLTFEEAQLFISIYERVYKDVDSVEVLSKDWQGFLKEEERITLENITCRLQEAMETFTKIDGYVFVKTSCRSAKDGPLFQHQFKDLYLEELKKLDEDERQSENNKVTCLLKAAFEALKVYTPAQVLDMFIRSERIYQDMMLAVNNKERFNEHFVIRKFVQIEVDMEFRGFVYDNTLTALSQYNYLIYSKVLIEKRDKIQRDILQFFNEEISPRMQSSQAPANYIIDFAICDNDNGEISVHFYMSMNNQNHTLLFKFKLNQ